MTNRAHLTPVPTTDKRGRATTVYRNLGTGPAPAGKAAVPAPAAPAAPVAAPAPRPLSDAELDGLIVALMGSVSQPPEFHAILVGEPVGRTAAALAMEAVEAGVFTEREMHRLITVAASSGEALNATPGPQRARTAALLVRDSIQVARRVAERLRSNGEYWPEHLVEAVLGARPTSSSMSDEDKFNSLAAVVAFAAADDSERFTQRDYHKDAVYQRIDLASLEALLRERPEDLDRILSYFAEHDDDEDEILGLEEPAVTELRKWLDETDETPAVGDGWL